MLVDKYLDRAVELDVDALCDMVRTRALHTVPCVPMYRIHDVSHANVRMHDSIACQTRIHYPHVMSTSVCSLCAGGGRAGADALELDEDVDRLPPFTLVFLLY